MVQYNFFMSGGNITTNEWVNILHQYSDTGLITYFSIKNHGPNDLKIRLIAESVHPESEPATETCIIKPNEIWAANTSHPVNGLNPNFKSFTADVTSAIPDLEAHYSFNDITFG
jgi:hypothetical protein